MDLRNGSGYEPKKFHIGINSHAPAIRRLWDPWNGASLTPFNGSEQAWRKTVKISKDKAALERKSQKLTLLAKSSTFYENQNQRIFNNPKTQRQRLKSRSFSKVKKSIN